MRDTVQKWPPNVVLPITPTDMDLIESLLSKDEGRGSAIPWVSMQHAVAAAAALVLGVVLVVDTGSSQSRGTDFFYYYCVLKLVAVGHGGHIYDLGALGHLERALAFPLRVPHGVIPNVYPPMFAVVLAPLAALPYTSAYVVWLVINCFLLGISVLQIERYARLELPHKMVFWVAAFSFVPVIVALLQGQFSIVLLALLAASLCSASEGREGFAGVALGITVLKPQYALAFLLVFLLQRRWRAIAAFCATAGALFLLSLPVVGFWEYPAYVHTLVHATSWGAGMGGFSALANRSFAGFTQLLLPAPAARVATLGLDLLVLLVLAYSALRIRSVDIPFGLAVVVALLTGQHVLIHDLSLLLIPAAVSLRYQHDGPRRVAIVLGLIYGAVLVGFKPGLFGPLQLPTLAMCALAGWLVWLGRHRWAPGHHLVHPTSTTNPGLGVQR